MKNIHPYNWIVLLITILLFSFGPRVSAQDPEPASLDYPNVKRDIKVVKETIKAYENGNWEELRAHLDKDAMVYNLGSYDSLNVEKTINYWTKGRESATPLISENGIWLGVSVSEGPREGKWILHWGNNTLNYPNGETISFPYHLATLMKDDKISKIYFYYDNSRIIRALGYSIDPPVKDDERDDDFENIEGHLENN